MCGKSANFYSAAGDSNAWRARIGFIFTATQRFGGMQRAWRDVPRMLWVLRQSGVLMEMIIDQYTYTFMFRCVPAHAHPNLLAGREYGNLPRCKAGKCECVGGILQRQCVECRNRYHFSKSLFDFSCENKSLVSDLK